MCWFCAPCLGGRGTVALGAKQRIKLKAMEIQLSRFGIESKMSGKVLVFPVAGSSSRGCSRVV